MNAEEITPLKAGQDLAVYHTFLLRLADDARLYGRRLGRISWLQGCALREARKVCARGDWLRMLNALGLKETTARYLRKIAEVITEAESLSLSYTEMLARCYPSYRAAVEKDLADEDAAAQDANLAGPPDPAKTPANDTAKTAANDTVKTAANDTVKNLTVCLKRLQRMLIPPEPPDAESAGTVENLRQLLGRIDAEVARIRTAIDRWTPDPAEPRRRPPAPPARKLEQLPAGVVHEHHTNHDQRRRADAEHDLLAVPAAMRLRTDVTQGIRTTQRRSGAGGQARPSSEAEGMLHDEGGGDRRGSLNEQHKKRALRRCMANLAAPRSESPDWSGLDGVT